MTTQKEPLTHVLQNITPEAAKAELFKLIGSLILLPLSASLALGVLMYLLSAPLSYLAAFFFIISFTGWTLLWVLKSIKAWEFKYLRKHPALPDVTKTTAPPPEPPILIATKSMILYLLIAGYVLITFAFACVYDALSASTALHFWQNFYMSITTMTTVGYGDFVPLGIGRFFACIEMIFGLIYQIIAIGAGATYLVRFNMSDEW